MFSPEYDLLSPAEAEGKELCNGSRSQFRGEGTKEEWDSTGLNKKISLFNIVSLKRSHINIYIFKKGGEMF